MEFKLQFYCRLLTLDGSLVSFTSHSQKDSKRLAAIMGNIWTSYDRIGHSSFNDDQPKSILFDYDEGRVALTAIGDFLLCLKGHKDNKFTSYKAKSEKLVKYLMKPLECLEF